MLIYNTTYVVDKNRQNAWKIWINETHIPYMNKTGKFDYYQTTKILFPENSDNTESFSVQFKIKDLEMLGVWSELHAEELQNEISGLFGKDVLPFSTVMEIID
ncbi:MAG: DUF4286 family protein [Paludibacteraceae bacterium]